MTSDELTCTCHHSRENHYVTRYFDGSGIKQVFKACMGSCQCICFTPVTRCKHGNTIDDTRADPSCAECEMEPYADERPKPEDFTPYESCSGSGAKEDPSRPCGMSSTAKAVLAEYVDPARHARAMVIYGEHVRGERRILPRGGNEWSVPSQSHSRSEWIVCTNGEVDFTTWHCNCPDCEDRDAMCKHILAVREVVSETKPRAWDLLSDEERAALVKATNGIGPADIRILFDGLRIDTFAENRDPEIARRMAAAVVNVCEALKIARTPFDMDQRVAQLGVMGTKDVVIRGRSKSTYDIGYCGKALPKSERAPHEAAPRATRVRPGVFDIDLPVEPAPDHSTYFSVSADGSVGADLTLTARRCENGSGPVTTAFVVRLHLKGAGAKPQPVHPRPISVPSEAVFFGTWEHIDRYAWGDRIFSVGGHTVITWDPEMIKWVRRTRALPDLIAAYSALTGLA